MWEGFSYCTNISVKISVKAIAYPAISGAPSRSFPGIWRISQSQKCPYWRTAQSTCYPCLQIKINICSKCRKPLIKENHCMVINCYQITDLLHIFICNFVISAEAECSCKQMFTTHEQNKQFFYFHVKTTYKHITYLQDTLLKILCRIKAKASVFIKTYA